MKIDCDFDKHKIIMYPETPTEEDFLEVTPLYPEWLALIFVWPDRGILSQVEFELQATLTINRIVTMWDENGRRLCLVTQKQIDTFKRGMAKPGIGEYYTGSKEG